jgi:hypothetical protein
MSIDDSKERIWGDEGVDNIEVICGETGGVRAAWIFGSKLMKERREERKRGGEVRGGRVVEKWRDRLED